MAPNSIWPAYLKLGFRIQAIVLACQITSFQHSSFAVFVFLQMGGLSGSSLGFRMRCTSRLLKHMRMRNTLSSCSSNQTCGELNEATTQLGQAGKYTATWGPDGSAQLYGIAVCRLWPLQLCVCYFQGLAPNISFQLFGRPSPSGGVLARVVPVADAEAHASDGDPCACCSFRWLKQTHLRLRRVS